LYRGFESRRKAWIFLVLRLLCVSRYRSLRLADPSSRGIPLCVRVCVCVFVRVYACVCVTLSVCMACYLVVHRNIVTLAFHLLCLFVLFVPQICHYISAHFVVLVLISPLFSAFLSFFILNVLF